MKKMIRKLFAAATIAVIGLTSSLSVSAVGVIREPLENPAYQSYVSKLEPIYRGDEICDTFEQDYKNLYSGFFFGIDSRNILKSICQLEYGNDKTRYFTEITIYWGGLSRTSTEPFDTEDTTLEEDIKAFISENNLNVELSKIIYNSYVNYEKTTIYENTIALKYPEDVTINDVVDATLALNKEFGYKIGDTEVLVSSFSISESTPVPTTTNETITLAGDLDLDNDTGLADIVILSKYNSNAEIYPISDETARANADVNNDGEINSLDINILIEQLLGGFESAV